MEKRGIMMREYKPIFEREPQRTEKCRESMAEIVCVFAFMLGGGYVLMLLLAAAGGGAQW